MRADDIETRRTDFREAVEYLDDVWTARVAWYSGYVHRSSDGDAVVVEPGLSREEWEGSIALERGAFERFFAAQRALQGALEAQGRSDAKEQAG